VNKPGHVLTGITFFSLYQKTGFLQLYKIFPNFKWENFVVYFEKQFYYPLSTIFILFILTLIGAVIPDIDLKLKDVFNDPDGKKRYLYHRQFTHSMLLWSAGFFYAAYTQNIYLFYFTLGGLSHLFGDMITGSVPVFLWGKYYVFWSRIGVDRIYKNPAFYSKLAKFLDKFMIIVAGISIGWALS